MAVTIKSPREIELMRKAGEILAQVHEELHAAVHPGMSTLDIDKLGERLIRSHGCIPSFKNYNGYPASICVCTNCCIHSRSVSSTGKYSYFFHFVHLVLYSSSFYRPSPRSLQLLGHSPFFTSSVGSTMIYKMLWIGFISPTT